MSRPSIDFAQGLEKYSADFRERAPKNFILMHLSIVPISKVTPAAWTSISKMPPTFDHPFFKVESQFTHDGTAIASALGTEKGDILTRVSVEETGSVYSGVVLLQENRSRNVFERKLHKHLTSISALLLQHAILGPYEVQCTFDFRKLKKAPMVELTNGFSAVVDLADKTVAYRFASEPIFS